MSKSNKTNFFVIEVPDVLSNIKVFEFTVKSRYGIHLKINITNISVFRCVTKYFKIIDNYTIKNLVGKVETKWNVWIENRL